jgi:hypothetical protein
MSFVMTRFWPFGVNANSPAAAVVRFGCKDNEHTMSNMGQICRWIGVSLVMRSIMKTVNTPVKRAYRNGGGTKMHLAVVLAGGLLLLTAGSTFAHHPFAAEFDWEKPITLTGTVTKVEWTNPHAFLFIDTKDDGGKLMHWTLEMGGPSMLTSRGWNRTTVKVGDQITVEGWLAKAKSESANVKSVRLPNGREVSGGSSLLDKEKPKS